MSSKAVLEFGEEQNLTALEVLGVFVCEALGLSNRAVCAKPCRIRVSLAKLCRLSAAAASIAPEFSSIPLFPLSTETIVDTAE